MVMEGRLHAWRWRLSLLCETSKPSLSQVPYLVRSRSDSFPGMGMSVGRCQGEVLLGRSREVLSWALAIRWIFRLRSRVSLHVD